MASGLIDLMKIASLEAMEAGKPTDLRFGVVTSVSPLKVQISNQLTIPSNALVVPQHLTDYDVDVKLGNDTRKNMKVYNALKINDKVALLRKAGGQQFLILDKI